MAKVKWKRTKDGIKFIEKKTFSERLQTITFMKTAIGIFILEAALFVFCVLRAALSRGGAGIEVSLIGYLIVFLGIVGIFVTCYGHYQVEAESRIPWKTGIYLNGASIAAIVIIYIVGLNL